MSMDTIISVDYGPADEAEADRIAAALTRLAERFELDAPDVDVWVSEDRSRGWVSFASYGHKYPYERIDAFARVVSRLIPGDVRMEEEGWPDGYWSATATYRAGRKVRAGHKEWVEADVQET